MQSGNFSTKAVVEAGLLSAIIVVLMLITVYIPFLSILNVILPVPVTILYLRHNYKVAISAVVVSGILVAMFYDPVSAINATAVYAITGMTLGYCIKGDKKLSFTIILLTLAGAVSYLIMGLLYIFILQPNGVHGVMNDINKIIEMYNNTVEQTKNFYKSMGMTPQQLDGMKQSFPVLTLEIIKLLVPGVIVVSLVSSACINYAIAKSILKKLKYKVRDFIPFSEFHISNKIGAVAVILFCIALILQSRNIAIGVYVLSFLTIIIRMTFLINGLALTTFYLRGRFKLNKIVVILILFFATLQFENIFFMLGLIDMIMDFRRLDADRLFKK
jgi:uncharacterized protein YybS (DUF2232 family)